MKLSKPVLFHFPLVCLQIQYVFILDIIFCALKFLSFSLYFLVHCAPYNTVLFQLFPFFGSRNKIPPPPRTHYCILYQPATMLGMQAPRVSQLNFIELTLTRPFSQQTCWYVTAGKAQVELITLMLMTPSPYNRLFVTPVFDSSWCLLWKRFIQLQFQGFYIIFLSCEKFFFH